MAEKVPTDWEEMYNEHRMPVFKHLCRLGASSHDAEDIAHEAFVTAYIQLPAFKGQSSLRTWIMGIAYNHLRNYRRLRRQRYEVEELVEELIDKSASSDDVLEQRETLRYLYGVLKGLPEEVGDTWIMAKYNGYSYDELATMFGIKINTVGSRISRVKDALQSAYVATEGKR